MPKKSYLLATELNRTFPENSTANVSLWRHSPHWLELRYAPKGGIPTEASQTTCIGYVHTHHPRILIPDVHVGEDASSVQWRIPEAAKKLDAVIELETRVANISSLAQLTGVFVTHYSDGSTGYGFSRGADACAVHPDVGLAYVLAPNALGWGGRDVQRRVMSILKNAQYRVFKEIIFAETPRQEEALHRVF